MPHEQRANCEADHCAFHDEDEPAGAAAIVCFECRHAFPDEAALVAATNNTRIAVGMEPIAITAEDITTCPHCAHDL